MTKLTTRLILFVLMTLLVAACNTSGNRGETEHGGVQMEPAPTGTTASHAGMAIGDSNQPFDELFIDSMIMHHQGAITMAQAAQTQAEHAELKTLISAIIADQTAEIKQMQTWRTAWYPNLPISKGLDMEMGAMQIANDPAKPFDLRFIEAMIPHHQSAIEMANLAQTKTEHVEIKLLASNIITAQTAEIAQMQAWKAAWFKP